MISSGPSVLHLADFINGYPFKPGHLTGNGEPVVRIRQLLDPEAPVDRAQAPLGAVRVDDGDLVFSWSATLAVRRWQRGPALLNQHLFRVDVRKGVNPRWFEYVLHLAIDHLRPLMHGSAMTHITREMLRSVTIRLPDECEQRAIADFLDAETARIDALITQKRRLVDAVRERVAIQLESAVRQVAAEVGETPLKWVVPEITVGIVVTPAKWYADEGVAALRGVNVSPGLISDKDLVRLSPEGHRANAKSTLHAGDLVVVRTGQAGAAAVVPDAFDGANCIDLLLIRKSRRLRSKYLEYVLNSDWTRKHIEQHSVGTIQAHFNVGALASLPVPVPPPDRQEQLVEELDRASAVAYRLATVLDRQIALLQEHRQALITAAVTGELAVPAAA